jgi:hypothetical protein
MWAACSSKIQKCPTMEITFFNVFMTLALKLNDGEMQ